MRVKDAFVLITGVLSGLLMWHFLRSLFAGNMVKSENEGSFEVQKSNADWRSQLSSEEFYVLRQKGTERAGSGKYDGFYPDEGYFKCAGCGNPLYSAAAKFKSGCGWPAFDKHYAGSIKTNTDNAFGMRRIEIVCAKCGGHLGHVFEGERMTPTNERHCVNSVSVKYEKGAPPAGLEEKKVL
mmetsp:Transcript_1727/g.5219  ORF Transcript_1727/g.5219 Transcript_1727/m.5219 type:complete len:182 (+) Transcript_1727:70-615(+)